MTGRITVAGCDAPTSPSVYVVEWIGDEPVYGCHCLVCNRCGHHTGNSNQGHYSGYCKVTKQMERFHLCCPDSCALHGRGDAA
jgi:hypothetical protein